MVQWLFPLTGLLLLLLLTVDVFTTVFHPDGHGGPLTRLLTRVVWRAWRGVAPEGEGRKRWLALAGPVLALLAPAAWALLIAAGYALLYYPWMEAFLVSPGSLRAHWAEALYYSGIAAATLGTGDIVPDLPALRLLSVVEALSGFALLSASLSYILAVYRENGRKTTLALDLSLHHPARPGEGDLRIGEQRETWLEDVSRELMHVKQAHAQYPILHYFRSSDARESLAVQLGPLVDLAEGRGTAREGSGPPTPGAELVARAVDRYLSAADDRFVPWGGEADGRSTTRERYRRLIDYLGYEPPAS